MAHYLTGVNVKVTEIISEVWYNPLTWFDKDAKDPAAKNPNDKTDPNAQPLEQVVAPNGMRGPEVADIQKVLKGLGYGQLLGNFGDGGVDGIIGKYTKGAIKKFQEDNNLKDPSGNVDQDTVNKLNELLNSKLKGKLTKSTSTDVKTGSSQPAVSSAELAAIQDPDFNKKLKLVADKLGIAEKDLKTIIRAESNFDPTAEDPAHVSVGLIGFTEQTANSLGTSKANIKRMPAVDQLDLVYRFYKMVGVQPGMDRGTIYMLTFMPAFNGAPDSTVLGKEGGGTLYTLSGGNTRLSMDLVWRQNPGFGKTKGKSYFTVGDVKNTINSM